MGAGASGPSGLQIYLIYILSSKPSPSQVKKGRPAPALKKVYRPSFRVKQKKI
jgi:hypothetical protein